MRAVCNCQASPASRCGRIAEIGVPADISEAEAERQKQPYKSAQMAGRKKAGGGCPAFSFLREERYGFFGVAGALGGVFEAAGAFAGAAGDDAVPSIIAIYRSCNVA